MEVEVTKAMIDRVEVNFDLKPERLIGDTAYGSAPMLSWLIDEKAIEPHVPVCDKTERKDGTFSRSDFQWDEQANEHHCPAGNALRCRRRNFKKKRTAVTKENTVIYRARQLDCQSCSLKQQCCPNVSSRKIARSVHENARDVARYISLTEIYKQSRKDRKKVEMLFAHLKRILKLDRLRLRGLKGANDEFLLAAVAQNLRKMVKLLSQPPPDHSISVPA